MNGRTFRSLVVLVVLVALGWCVRYGAKRVWSEEMDQIPGLLTPISSMRRVCEGAYLQQTFGDRYRGWALRHAPLLAVALEPLCSLPWVVRMSALYMAEVVAAVALFLLSDRRERPDAAESFGSWLLAALPAAVLLLSPHAIAQALAGSTEPVAQAALLGALVLCSHGRALLGLALLAAAAYCSLHPLLLLPLCVLWPVAAGGPAPTLRTALLRVAVFAAAAGALLGASWALVGNWSFLERVYVFMLLGTEADPAVGLWWYFFVEMFAVFAPFFRFAFNFHAVFHAVGIAIKFRRVPLLGATALLWVTALLRPYAAYADTTLALAMLCATSDVVREMRLLYVTGTALLAACALAPPLYYMWVLAGTANANFFWAAGLVLALAQVFMLLDYLRAAAVVAHRKRR